MRRHSIGLTLALVLLAGACGSTTATTQPAPAVPAQEQAAPIPPTATLQQAADGEDAFGLDLFRVIAPGAARQNTAISPASIANVLGMILAGARGETAQQILDALHVKLPASELHGAIGGLVRALARDNSKDVILQQADRVWLNNGLQVLASFSDTLTRDYDAQLGRIDMSNTQAAADAMNAWAAQATHGKITKFVQPDDLVGAQLVLANAVYLDAKWKHQFKADATYAAPFHTIGGGAPMVSTMHQVETFAVDEGNDFTAIALPYAGDQLEMDVIMPNDLAAFERTFDTERLQTIVAGMHPDTVVLALPKFELRGHFTDLQGQLEQLGIRDAFGNADLSGITGKPGLVVSHVVHESFVHVDEQGTIAAAVTGGMIATSAEAAPHRVTIDHPFVFVVRDTTTGTVLFVGHVVDPSAAAS